MPTWIIDVQNDVSKIPPMTFEAEADSRAEALTMIEDFALSVPQGLVVVGTRLLSKRQLRLCRQPRPNMCTVTRNEQLVRHYDMIKESILDHDIGCHCRECRLYAWLRDSIRDRQEHGLVP